MNTSVNLSRLNVAPDAPRQHPLTWLMLAASVAVFSAALFPLASHVHRLDAAKAHQQLLQQAVIASANELRREKIGGADQADLRREKARREFQAMIGKSWEGIFDALESAALAVNGGTSIMLMTQKKTATGDIHFDLTALASNLPIMLAYLNALKADPRIQTVELITHQPDLKTSPDAVRFQIVVSMHPNWTAVQLPSPTASAPTSTYERAGRNARTAIPTNGAKK